MEENKHTGSSFDNFLEDEGIELLEKAKCVRCGKPNMNGTKGGRCKACMDKLSSKRAKPGSKERSWKHADQAIRREEGRSGTTTGGHKNGHGNRQLIQKKMQAAEKKTGQKLSLDRKNNERGYEGKNTRAVPEAANRGRHHVDPKKLRAWKKRMKKSAIEVDDLYTLMKANATAYPALSELLKAMGPDGLGNYIEMFDKAEPPDTSAKPDTASHPNLLFVYRTLKDRMVTKKLLHRDIEGDSDRINDYEEISTNTPEGKNFDTVVPHEGNKVDGLILHLSDEELEKLDNWEDQYIRDKATTASGKSVWVYKLDPKYIDKK